MPSTSPSTPFNSTSHRIRGYILQNVNIISLNRVSKITSSKKSFHSDLVTTILRFESFKSSVNFL